MRLAGEGAMWRILSSLQKTVSMRCERKPSSSWKILDVYRTENSANLPNSSEVKKGISLTFLFFLHVASVFNLQVVSTPGFYIQILKAEIAYFS